MRDAFSQIFRLLSSKERVEVLVLFGLNLAASLFDVAGVASLMPFIMVLSNPTVAFENELISALYSISPTDSKRDFLSFLGIALIGIFLVSLSIRAYAIFYQFRFVLNKEHVIGLRLFQTYMMRPYSWLSVQNSSDLTKNILSELSRVIVGALLPAITLLTQVLLAASLTIFLLVFQPVSSALLIVVFFALYLLVFHRLRSLVDRVGRQRFDANKDRFRVLDASFSNAKFLKTHGFEDFYFSKFNEAAEKYAASQTIASVVGYLPKYVIEAIGIAVLVAFLVFYLDGSNDFLTALPVVSVYLFSGYRLLPALQQSYNSMTEIRFILPVLEKVLANEDIELNREEVSLKKRSSVRLITDVSLENVNFSYSEGIPALKNINFFVNKGERVGLVGRSGSGKSTLIDIILGLRSPTMGRLLINKTNKEDVFWGKNISYVQQEVILFDGTILENIAMARSSSEIDLDYAAHCARLACVDKFIDSLSDGYATLIGDKGSRLSGGQRQRISIARSLYSNSNFLVLDEATSALDHETEARVISNLFSLPEMTIIISTHNISTLKHCDRVYMLDEGAISIYAGHRTRQVRVVGGPKGSIR